MKILILGTGGYVDAVLIPALKKFKNIEIFITSNNSINIFNFSKRHNIKYFNYQFQIENFEAFFLCMTPLDNLQYLNSIPYEKFVWIEKPLFPFKEKQLINFKNKIIKSHVNLHVGFNRSCGHAKNLIKENLKNNLNLIEINYQIFKEEISPFSWRNSRIYHSPFWVDGINAYDLHRNCAQILTGNTIKNSEFVSSKTILEKDDGSLLFKIIYDNDKNKVITKIGNVFEANLKINNKKFDIWDNKNAIKFCFHNINDMFKRKFNFENSFYSHFYMRNLLTNKMKYTY